MLDEGARWHHLASGEYVGSIFAAAAMRPYAAITAETCRSNFYRSHCKAIRPGVEASEPVLSDDGRQL